ncbi:MAG: indole-3-glycerol-phosphate synthase [Woeseiaceae bacterium]
MSDFLKSMAESSAARAAMVSGNFSASELDSPVVELALRGFDVIAEIKDASPSEGALATAAADRGLRAKQYSAGGAAAISVLTEPLRFAGDIAHLREVVSAVSGEGIPVMRKDFLVEPVQILEARAAGASGVLLIAAMLSEAKLRSMLDCAYDHSLFVLLEAFDESDLQRCTSLLAEDRHQRQAAQSKLLIGINTRNLRTLEVDPGRLATLAMLLPPNAICVAESGLVNEDDAAVAAALGYRVALVGTALMRSSDPVTLIAGMCASGRRRLAEQAC